MTKQYAWSWEDAGLPAPTCPEEAKQAKRDYQKNRYQNDPEYRETHKAKMKEMASQLYHSRYGVDLEYTERRRTAARERARKIAAAKKAKGGSPDAAN